MSEYDYNGKKNIAIVIIDDNNTISQHELLCPKGRN